jgi:hypothetical protein
MSTSEELNEILDFLNDRKMRATYGAVANYLGVGPRAMGKLLGEPSQRASWVVNATEELPTGYPPELIHPDLHRISLLIDTAGKLDRGLQRWRGGVGLW